MNIPKVGSQVIVTTKYRNVILGGEPFKLFKTTGTVLQPSKWMSPHEFMIATGEEMRPKAVINLSNVIDIQYLKGSGSQINSDVRTFKVTSKSSGKSYIVTATPKGVQCTCVGFEYRKYCKHSQAVSKKIKG